MSAAELLALAEGVREAAARAAYESWYKDAPYSWDNERGQKDLWYRIIDAVSPILTTRPTDTAAREAAVEAATVERCAKVADAVESQDEAAEPAYLDACQTISERIRALTPAHIADAGKADTAARDEGTVREVMMVINDMRRAGGAANVWADRVQDALEGDAA